MFSAIQHPEHCIHTLLSASTDSDRSLRPRVITANYQWLSENYNINRSFPVPFSNTYNDSVLVLGIASVFCVLKFASVFLLFLFMCKGPLNGCVCVCVIHVQMLIFHCSRNPAYTRLLCAFYNK